MLVPEIQTVIGIDYVDVNYGDNNVTWYETSDTKGGSQYGSIVYAIRMERRRLFGEELSRLQFLIGRSQPEQRYTAHSASTDRQKSAAHPHG
jgi:hypothetical protein